MCVCVCLFVCILASVIRLANRTFSAPHCIVTVASPALPYVSTLSHKWNDLWKKKLLNVKCLCWLSVQLLSETFLILSRFWPDSITSVHTYIHTVYRSAAAACNYRLFFSDFMALEFCWQRFKNTQIYNFIKIRPVGAELFSADRRTWWSWLLLFEILRRRIKRGDIRTAAALRHSMELVLLEQLTIWRRRACLWIARERPEQTDFCLYPKPEQSSLRL
jgi:hypothetical protein